MPRLKPLQKTSGFSQNGLGKLLPNKRTVASLPLPKKVKCFQCAGDFYVKYVIPNKSYSKKNNWEYWTNPIAKDPEFWKDKTARQKDKQICDSCLRKFYYDKEVYWETITDLKNRAKLRTYLHQGIIS